MKEIRCKFLWLALLPALGSAPAFADDRRPEIETLLSAYRLAEAEAAAHAWVTALESSKQTDSLDYASALEAAAHIRSVRGDSPKLIRPSVEQALALRTRRSGPEDPTRGYSLNLLGGLKFSEADYKECSAQYQRALSLEQANPARTPRPLLAETLVGLGRCKGFEGDTAAGLRHLQAAFELRTAEYGAQHASVIEVLGLLSTTSYQAGDLARAEDYALRAIKMAEAVHGERSFAVGQLSGSLASVYKDRGEYEKARPLHELAVRVYETTFGPEHPRLVVQYNNLGLCLKELGDVDGARKALEHALAISEKAYGPDASTTATVLGNLGIALKEGGDLNAARDTYERALAIQEKRLGPEHSLVSAVLLSLGTLLVDMGETAAGRTTLERALKISQKAQGAAAIRTIEIEEQLGTLLITLKDFQGAQAIFQKAYDASRTAFGDDNTRTAAALASYASGFAAQGDYAGARERYQTALLIQEAKLGVSHYYTMQTVLDLARVEQFAGNLELALKLYNRTIDAWRDQFGSRYPDLAAPMAHSAECLEKLGRTKEAFASALASAEIRRYNLDIVARASAERQALLYASKDRTGMDVALRLAASGKLPESSVREVWDSLIRQRTLVLDEMAERRKSLVTSADSETTALAAQVTEAREHLAAAVVRGPGSRDNGYAAQVSNLRTTADDVERKLAARSSQFRRRNEQERKGYEAVAGSLPAESALIAYASYSGGYAAFVLRADQKAPRLVALGSSDRINRAVTAWRKEIDRARDSMGRLAAKNEAQYRVAGADLRRAIWDPVSAVIAGLKRIYIVSDGAIQLVNFAALPTGSASYLIESSIEIHLISSEKDIAPSPPPAVGTMLAVGGAAFDSRRLGTLAAAGPLYRGAACAGYASLVFPALPGSAGEAQAVLKIGASHGMTGTSLSGDKATEASFKSLAPGNRVIHIATHGFFLGEQCTRDSAMVDNPLLRSGLAFAGANQRKTARTSEEDGILTAEEVASLNLEHADWVVLSGCDTGAGEIRTGEGVLGMRRAFHIAGARMLIMSLWPVDDEATRRWMVNLYEAHFGRNLNAAASVRSASLRQLHALRTAKKSTHPFYWAGFIAAGG